MAARPARRPPDLSRPTPGRPERALAIGQGAFYVATGVWPLVSIATFERVTGPKTDRWLVRTVGLLVTVIGAAVLLDGATGRRAPDRALATGAALALATVDVVYVARGVLARVYLLDAVAECALAAAWLALPGGNDRARSGAIDTRLQPPPDRTPAILDRRDRLAAVVRSSTGPSAPAARG